MPTLLEWIGSPAASDLDGVSLWPNLASGGAIGQRTLIADGILYGDPQTMIQRWPMKVVVGDQLRPLRATSLDVDPKENRNLLETRVDVADSLLDELRKLQARTAVRKPTLPPGVDPSVLDRLRSLGYIR